MFAAPPKSHWPPTPSAKVRWKSASFVPLELIRSLLAGEAADENKWVLDPISECLLPLDRGVSEGPFRIGFRSAAAVDRLAEGTACAHGVSVLEFVENAGWWAVAAFSSEESRERWRAPVEGAFRLLADSGFGGERSRGWGRAHAPQLEDGVLPDLLVPPRQEAVSPGPIESEAPAGTCAWWLLSLFVPSENDRVDWKRGRYDLLARSGRVESPAGWGIEKKQLKMVSEGSVLEAEGALSGCVTDVAPDAFPHPVHKAGFALAVAIPKRVNP
jgi:CRISPR type III-A-associated RAMP protein Csm4